MNVKYGLSAFHCFIIKRQIKKVKFFETRQIDDIEVRAGVLNLKKLEDTQVFYQILSKYRTN